MTNKVKKQILKVRNTGRTNMLDCNGVMYVANAMRLYDLVVYLNDRENKREYWHFIMTGEANMEDDGCHDEDRNEPYDNEFSEDEDYDEEDDEEDDDETD